jgi:murein L,D-transpeptidase YcbB/YkuD
MRFVIFYLTRFRLIAIVKKAFLLVILVSAACHNFKEQSGQIITDGETASTVLLDTSLISHTTLAARASVRKFYDYRDFLLQWSDSSDVNAMVDTMVNVIRHAGSYGLIGEDYHLNELEELLKDTVSTDRHSRMDLLLTDSYLAIRYHLKHGRLDPKTYQRADISAIVDDEAIAALQKTGANMLRSELDFLGPTAEQYRMLKTELQKQLSFGRKDSIQVQRTMALSVNMERWRWEKVLPDRYVSVNIPAFLLRVIENDSVWLESRVIVGKRETPTPVIESVIRSFIIYPYWHVPRSISTKEILPALQMDSTYLHKHNFDVLDQQGKEVDASLIHWDEYDAQNFPFVLRQREGSENSMGIIKFNFPNNYGVYLHDTNSKRLYTSKKRDLSHGCVRVNKAVNFAHYLVREDDIYVSPEDLDQYLTLQQRLKIDLRKPIPLKLQYFTCEFDKGSVRFYDDIYKKDSVMIQSLYHIPIRADVGNPAPL